MPPLPGPKRQSLRSLEALERAVPECRRCPELRSYLTRIGTTRRRAYRDCEYWARPVPGFGDRAARILIVGLAPAAHGANRTGRMFTGDRSGEFRYAALYRARLADRPVSREPGDGLRLLGVYITAALRCAPPANKPTRPQLFECRRYLVDELSVLRPPVTIGLGAIAFGAVLDAMESAGHQIGRPRPKFGHTVEYRLGGTVLLGCYHVSQQNTFTGRLTAAMLDAVLCRAKEIACGRRARESCES